MLAYDMCQNASWRSDDTMVEQFLLELAVFFYFSDSAVVVYQQ